MKNPDNVVLLTQIVGSHAATSVATRYETLTDITKADPLELQALADVGPCKAGQIKAALNLACSLSREILGDAPLMDNPETIANYLREDVRPYRVETFKVVLLNTRRRLIRVVTMATGGLDTLYCHAREVFQASITANAAAIVLVHNHPSGDPTPSEADIKVTRDLIRAGQLLKIEVLDHVILGLPTESQPKGYSSLRELGYFYA